MVAPFVAPKSNINKAELIALRKRQAEESAAKKNAELLGSAQPSPESGELARRASLIRVEDAIDKLGIIFDNSGSMSGKKLEDAKAGVVEFLRNCHPNNTAVAIYLLNFDSSMEWGDSEIGQLRFPATIEAQKMSSDLVLLASEILEPSIKATGGTPLYETISKALKSTPAHTRLVAFSDGQPSIWNKHETLSSAKNMGIPIDTVFIATPEDAYHSSKMAIDEMKYIAEMTGGIFLDLSKGDIKSGLKYLAPAKRLMLADSSFKAKVERGEA